MAQDSRRRSSLGIEFCHCFRERVLYLRGEYCERQRSTLLSLLVIKPKSSDGNGTFEDECDVL